MYGSAARRPEEIAKGPERRPEPAPMPSAGVAPACDWPGFGSKDPAERTMALCEGLIDLTAALFNVSGKEMRLPGRTAQGVSRVRQIAMYIAHTSFGIIMAEVGRCFGRDRTTVLHACHLIEDLRDDEEFERILTMTERVALAAFGARAGRTEARR